MSKEAEKLRRWNFDADDQSVLVCKGEHEGTDICHMERLHPAEVLAIVNAFRAEALQAAELIRLQAEQIRELREALRSAGLFLHHCWRDVQMNDYSFERLNEQMKLVDAALSNTKEET